MTTKLDSMDFMMMDVHRPITDDDIVEHPQAKVDRSLRLVPDVDPIEENVADEPERYKGPFVNFSPNVEVLDVATSQELDINRVLQSTYDNKMSTLLVIGVNADGLFVLGSDPDIAVNNMLCDRAKRFFMDALDSGDTREDPRDPKKPA